LNIAQTSGHYYGNDGLDAMRPDPVKVRAELKEYRRLRGRPRSAKARRVRMCVSIATHISISLFTRVWP
jgi:hypothetical protein